MGLKRHFTRFAPERSTIQNHRHLSLFGKLLHEPNLWHINRQSAAGGMANGLFWAFMPFPGQTVLAAAIAIYFRVNLPISLLAVWLTNPLTMYPIYFAAYKLGALLLDVPHHPFHFEISWQWFTSTLTDIWQPLLLGSVILGTLSSVTSYYFIRGLWRFAAVRKWEERKERMRLQSIQKQHSQEKE